MTLFRLLLPPHPTPQGLVLPGWDGRGHVVAGPDLQALQWLGSYPVMLPLLWDLAFKSFWAPCHCFSSRPSAPPREPNPHSLGTTPTLSSLKCFLVCTLLDAMNYTSEHMEGKHGSDKSEIMKRVSKWNQAVFDDQQSEKPDRPAELLEADLRCCLTWCGAHWSSGNWTHSCSFRG